VVCLFLTFIIYGISPIESSWKKVRLEKGGFEIKIKIKYFNFLPYMASILLFEKRKPPEDFILSGGDWIRQ
jgi:hypothetical protein